MKKVAIIILGYSQDKLLKECLRSIVDMTDYKNYKVFVVDDSGTGKINKALKESYEPYDHCIVNVRNIGCSKSVNEGIKYAMNNYHPDYFVWLNDDTKIIDPLWLTKLVAVAEKDEDIGIVGCRIVYPDGRFQNIGGYMGLFKIIKSPDRKDVVAFEVDHIMGAVMLIKKEVIIGIGLFDEIFSPFLLEDTDYCQRCQKAGYKVISCADTTIIHHKGQSFDFAKNTLMMKIRFKNDIIFSKRHFSTIGFLIRAFIFLPGIAIFRKKSDEVNIGPTTIVLRPNFAHNLLNLFKSYRYIF